MERACIPGCRPFLSKKPVIASQCSHWRGNPFLLLTHGVTDSHDSDIGHCLGMTGYSRVWASQQDLAAVIDTTKSTIEHRRAGSMCPAAG